MFNFLKKQSLPDRAALLAAIPTKNKLIRESVPEKNTLRLTAPLKKNRLLPSPAKEKSFDLDDLGISLWRSINNKRTVEQLIENFATLHRVNPREAEVAVLAFLKTLTQRNLIALASPKN